MFDRVPARGPSWCLRSGMAGLPASSEGEGSSSCAVSTDSSDAPNVQSLISVLKAPKHSDLSRSRRVFSKHIYENLKHNLTIMEHYVQIF